MIGMISLKSWEADYTLVKGAYVPVLDVQAYLKVERALRDLLHQRRGGTPGIVIGGFADL